MARKWNICICSDSLEALRLRQQKFW